MRVSRTGAAVTLTAAALLVVGVDYATFATTGDSLILGTLNHSRTTTTLVKNGAGPALRLTSRGTKKPSLAVSSPARVRRLNATRLDGQTASTLASKATTYKAGARRDVYPGQAIWPLPMHPGVYQASFKAFLFPNPATPGTSVEVICGLADLNTVTSSNAQVYTAESSTYSGNFPVLMSGAESVRIVPPANPGLLCVTSTGDDFTLFKPVTTSWTPINHRRVESVEALTVPASARRSLMRQFEGYVKASPGSS